MFRPLQLRFRGTVGKLIPLEATGGQIVTTYTIGDQIYKYHFFTQTSNFVVTQLSNSFNTVETVIVAGGGGGGAADNQEEAGAGGGAGGYRTLNLGLSATGTYPVTVGAAGNGGSGGSRVEPGPGTKGGPSSVFGFESAGGGGGLTARGGDYGGIANGGSGGGGTDRSNAFGLGNIPATTPSQGNNGAEGAGGPFISGLSTIGGGGGGAGSPGLSNSTGGNGVYVDSNFLPAPLVQTLASSLIGEDGTGLLVARGGKGGTNRTYGTTFLGYGNGGGGGGAAGEVAGQASQFHPPGLAGYGGIVILRYRIQ